MRLFGYVNRSAFVVVVLVVCLCVLFFQNTVYTASGNENLHQRSTGSGKFQKESWEGCKAQKKTRHINSLNRSFGVGLQ